MKASNFVHKLHAWKLCHSEDNKHKNFSIFLSACVVVSISSLAAVSIEKLLFISFYLCRPRQLFETFSVSFSFVFLVLYFPANAHDCENFMLTLDYKIISPKYYPMANYDKFINSCQPPVFINETKSRLFYDFPLKGALRHRHWLRAFFYSLLLILRTSELCWKVAHRYLMIIV